MRKGTLSGLLLLSGGLAGSSPIARHTKNNVTFEGLERNGIEVFLNIPYGEDTGGENRFKPPRLHVPDAGSTVKAQSYGPACPQPLGEGFVPLVLGEITDVSEDCLNLNVARPKGTSADDRLPVMVWIHGGGFWSGANNEPTTAPDGLVLESVENGLPVISVAMNYRLGCKGGAPRFASAASDVHFSLRLRSIGRTAVRGIRECRPARPETRARMGAGQYRILRRRSREGHGLWPVVRR